MDSLAYRMDEQKPAGPNQLQLQKLEEILGHRFSEPELLIQALTHRSFAAETRKDTRDNERLEFLGDAVLELVISHILYKKFGHEYDEGDLTKMRAYLVNEASLATMARELDLGPALRLGRGEDKSGGREKPSILADAFEAVIGALYLDGGIEKVFDFVERFFKDLFQLVATRGLSCDYKTALQEFTQARFHSVPVYQLEHVQGPAHQRTFEVSLHFDGKLLARGKGKSKKEAEQQAAKQALETLKQ